MLKIKNITGGRFGNRILHYNSLVQISKKFEIPFQCTSWEGNIWFDGIEPDYVEENSENISWKEIYNESYITKIKNNSNYNIDGTIIHNFFYELTNIDPKKIFKIKKQYLPNFKNNNNVGVHIRGTDIRGADNNNCREVHSLDYYKKSIDFLASQVDINTIYICTDDLNFDLVQNFYLYCTKKFGTRVFFGPASVNKNIEHIYDFALLTECDYLISGSSTYVVCAGFIGKDKKIIHSMEWFDKNLPGNKYVKWGNHTEKYPKEYWDSFDNFWIKLYEGGSKFYKAWKIL